MKINDSQLIEGFKQVVQGPQAQRAQQGIKEVNQNNGQTATDDVKLSSKARFYQKIKKAALEAPEIRKEKVEGIKERIDTGTYNIKGERVAEKIVQESLVDTFL